MGINVLHHVTVKTDDLEATRDFYRDVLGLEEGFRPELDFPGYWLYCGEVPVVHLVPRQNAIGGLAMWFSRYLMRFFSSFALIPSKSLARNAKWSNGPVSRDGPPPIAFCRGTRCTTGTSPQ